MAPQTEQKIYVGIGLDFETGGLDCRECACTQIALQAVRFDTWQVFDRYQAYIAPYGKQDAGLPRRKCVTKKFHIHGYRKNPDLTDHMYVYGSDEPKILRLIEQEPALGEKLSQKFGYTLAEVVWAVREEKAITIEDVLARRVRMLFVDAREAMAAAPKAAAIMARELGRDQAWIDEQVKSFTDLAKNYIFEQK